MMKFQIGLNILQVKKSGFTNIINHNFAGIGINLYNSLPIEKILTLHNVITLIKSDVIENKIHYYYNILLKKGTCKYKSITQYF